MRKRKIALAFIAGFVFIIGFVVGSIKLKRMPSVTLTAPTAGSTVGGLTSVSALTGISKVEFFVDGFHIGTATNPPYTVGWNTTMVPDGPHTLQARAYDLAGVSDFSAPVSITVRNSQPPTNSWTKRLGSAGADYGNAVIADAQDNVIVAGSFQGSVDFGGTILTSQGSSDMFLAKYTRAGALLWAKRYGAAGSESPNAIALDSGGNIIVAGQFYGTANFGGTNKASLGDADAFIAKYDANGNHIWSEAFGGTAADVITSVAIASDGVSIVATGHFGSPTINIGGVILTTSGRADTFLLKYRPSGTIIWAKNFFSGDSDYGRAVAVDKRNDDIVLCGYFQNNINFVSNLFEPNNPAWVANWLRERGGYIAKFNGNGGHIWSKRFGVSGIYWTRFWAMALDPAGDIVLAGDFFQQTDLGAGLIQGTSYGTDLFVAKYSGVSGAYRWAVPILGVTNAIGRPMSISTDTDGDVVMAGYFQAMYNFGSQSLTNAVQDGMVAKYSGTGTPLWARQFRSTGYASALGVDFDSTGTPVFAGYVSGGGSYEIIFGRMDP